jgi:hypothetical protein
MPKSKKALKLGSNKSSKKQKECKGKYNLVYMAKPIYGGWVSFTAHLSKKCNYPLYKISNKTEKKSRDYGYDVSYTNLCLDDILKLKNLFITAVDKKYYEFLPKIKNATIVIHDPTELKEPVLEAIKRFKVITIRETVQKLLKEKYGINSTFLHHPFFEFPVPKTPKSNTRAVALSRVDFDKHTDIIIKANTKLKNPVEIYGALNDLYVYHKLRDLPFQKYYKGKFPKEFNALNDLLGNTKYVVDMSAINKDGGGSQYSFLEAIYLNCALILNKKWVEGVKTPFKHGVNCFVVADENELEKLLKSNPDTSKIVKNARKMLAPHISGKGW